MLYTIVRPFAALALKIFLRKITLTHTERIPHDKPVLLAVNHPTAFMEPCILACFLNRPLYFLVRGDIFVKPFYVKLLRALHMLPMYRLKDRGYKFVKENFQTLDACFDALQERKTIMILAEGTTIAEKRLRPLKKGMARIAFGAIDKYPDIEDVYVVPVGVNFDYMDRFRAEVMIDFGEPLSARSFYDTYYANNTEGIDAITSVLTQRMTQLLVCIDHKEDETLTEHLLQIARSSRPANPFPVLNRNPALLQEEIALASAVNSLPAEPKKTLALQCNTYFDTLAKAGINDRVVGENRKPALAQTVLLGLGAPLFAAGYLLNYIPARIAQWIADTRVKHIEFYAPVMVVVAMFLYLLYYGAVLGLGLRYVGRQAIPITVLLAASGYFAVLYREYFQAWYKQLKWIRLKPHEKAAVLQQRAPVASVVQQAVRQALEQQGA